jgi:hypothetical protein
VGKSTKRFSINAVDSAGRDCTLIITEYWTTLLGDVPLDIFATLDRATCETEDGQILVGGGGKFRSLSSGAEFTSNDPRALRF